MSRKKNEPHEACECMMHVLKQMQANAVETIVDIIERCASIGSSDGVIETSMAYSLVDSVTAETLMRSRIYGSEYDLDRWLHLHSEHVKAAVVKSLATHNGSVTEH